MNIHRSADSRTPLRTKALQIEIIEQGRSIPLNPDFSNVENRPLDRIDPSTAHCHLCESTRLNTRVFSTQKTEIPARTNTGRRVAQKCGAARVPYDGTAALKDRRSRGPVLFDVPGGGIDLLEEVPGRFLQFRNAHGRGRPERGGEAVRGVGPKSQVKSYVPSAPGRSVTSNLSPSTTSVRPRTPRKSIPDSLEQARLSGPPRPGPALNRPLSRYRTRCPRCPASRGTTRCSRRQSAVAPEPRRARPVARIRPQARPGAPHPRARCRPARRDAADS